MRVNEIFPSFQGEGASVGMPCTFLRLAVCNLHCKWCDTPYAWNFSDTEKERWGLPTFKQADECIELDIPTIVETLREMNTKNLVITGGEPLLQQDKILELLKQLPEIEKVEIETNGTIAPDSAFLKFQETHGLRFNCSPKLASSGNTSVRFNLDALRRLTAFRRTIFKFVVSTPDDFPEITDIIKQADIYPHNVYLMAEGASKEEQEKNQKETAELAAFYGWNFTPRLHILMYDKKRKV